MLGLHALYINKNERLLALAVAYNGKIIPFDPDGGLVLTKQFSGYY